MRMKPIRKIDYKVRLKTGVNTDHGYIEASAEVVIDIYFNDGRVYKDVDICWGPYPMIRDDKLRNDIFTVNENSEIEVMLDGFNKKLNTTYAKGIWYPINEFSKHIEKLKATGSILGIEDVDEHGYDYIVVNINNRIVTED